MEVSGDKTGYTLSSQEIGGKFGVFLPKFFEVGSDFWKIHVNKGENL